MSEIHDIIGRAVCVPKAGAQAVIAALTAAGYAIVKRADHEAIRVDERTKVIEECAKVADDYAARWTSAGLVSPPETSSRTCCEYAATGASAVAAALRAKIGAEHE